MRATWIRNLAYALPALPLAALYLPLFSYVTPFYANERGVDIAALGAAWIAIRMFDAVSDPLAGWLSDRTVRVIGRRGWVILAVPLILVATWQAFVPPEDAGLPHAVRSGQVEFLLEVCEQLYPRLRIYLFDARRLYSAPLTVFGPLLAALYIGQSYMVFRDTERVRALTAHFDHLVREAHVTARNLPGHVRALWAGTSARGAIARPSARR